MITVYTQTWNEELLIQFMIDHYRERFPGCRIVVYDKISTDKTVKIARAKGCEVVTFDNHGEFNDRQNMDIKNNCWKAADTDWVLVCDLDELLDINESQLKAEEAAGTTIITPEVWDMINMEDNLNIAGMKYGARGSEPGKRLLFNKKYIREMNYGPGAHSCQPIGKVNYSRKAYKLYHYASINEDVTIERFRVRGPTLSPENLEKGWGLYVLMSPDEIRAEYAAERKRAKKVR